MIRRHYALLCCLLLAAHLTGCKASQHQPTPDERANAGIVPAPVGLDSLVKTTKKIRISSSAPALLPRLTDALGISTPAGRERRQARKDAAATVPRSIKVKNGALAWGANAKAANAGKKANLATDSATQQVATNAVAGRGNTVRQTATAAPRRDWVGIGQRIAVAAALGVGLYCCWPVLWPLLLGLFRRRNP